jgi:predicted ester cyclase
MKQFALGTLLVLSATGAMAAETRIYCDGNEANLESYLGMHDVLFMQREGSRVGEWYAPKVLSHDQDAGGSSTTYVTHAEMENMWKRSKETTPNRVLINDLILCMGDFVVARVRMKGTRLGPLPGLEPGEAGRDYETSAIDIYRFEEGKVVERWGNNDGITMMRQLGLLPAAENDEE